MKKIKFVPFGDNVLVQQIDNKGRLAVPENVREKERPSLGVVLELGPEFEDALAVEWGTIKKGDTVAFPVGMATEIRLAGVKLFVLCKRDLLGKLEEVEVEDAGTPAGK